MSTRTDARTAALPLDRRAALGLLAAALAVGAAVAAPQPARAAALGDIFGKRAEGSTKTVDHADWDRLLAAYVRPAPDGVNRVAYAKWKAEGHAALKTYVARLEAVDVASLDRAEQFAFWSNLYNAKTIDVVLDKHPVGSIKDINLGGGLLTLVTGGPWKAKIMKVGGQALSLDDVEHGILRPLFKDPRVHYAVNCASFGCPNLGTEAFTGAKLDAQLEAAARAFVNNPRGVTVEAGKVQVSSIYHWFKEDFGGNDAGVLAHVRKYAAPELKAKLDAATGIAGHAYDWRLNEVTP